MDIVLIAVCIVAALLGTLTNWLAVRAGAEGWLAMFLGFLVLLLCFAAGPGLFQ